MYIDLILGTSTKLRIIKYILKNKSSRLLEKELAIASSATVSVVNAQIQDLVNAQVLTIEKFGRNKIYTINKDHFLVEQLSRLFERTAEQYDIVSQKLVEKISEILSVHSIYFIDGAYSQKTPYHLNLRTKPSYPFYLIVTIDREGSENYVKLREMLIHLAKEDLFTKYQVFFDVLLIDLETFEQKVKLNDILISSYVAKGKQLFILEKETVQ